MSYHHNLFCTFLYIFPKTLKSPHAFKQYNILFQILGGRFENMVAKIIRLQGLKFLKNVVSDTDKGRYCKLLTRQDSFCDLIFDEQLMNCFNDEHSREKLQHKKTKVSLNDQYANL
eukprot:TRINITY_DN29610_c0_g1_i1.p2 TRINITY_DN29610_c0_g1~~TRINITY_DN29610_c0_g1_i1.p2  ORF type:complete len:116 (-),score=2.18 TRINITY_DN29610_c0_g1_i1:217-564(-)